MRGQLEVLQRPWSCGSADDHFVSARAVPFALQRAIHAMPSSASDLDAADIARIDLDDEGQKVGRLMPNPGDDRKWRLESAQVGLVRVDTDFACLGGDGRIDQFDANRVEGEINAARQGETAEGGESDGANRT